MIISSEQIKALNPCISRLENFLHHYPQFEGSLKEFLSLDKITHNDKVWVSVRVLDHKQLVRWSTLCARSVLHIFESKFPDDDRPRKALEAAEAFLQNPLKDADAAAAAADAIDAANAATHANVAVAADAAYYAARTASTADYATSYATRTAAAAVYVNNGDQLSLNLQFLASVEGF